MVRVNLAGQTAHPGTLSLGTSIAMNLTITLTMVAKVLSPTWCWDGAMVGMTYLMMLLDITSVSIKVTDLILSILSILLILPILPIDLD